ncbi:hypothetical protein [Aliarcobacter cryaerophilus]|jgi:hypothetical protein|uniref:Uncharacterized protein n=1 Tax=Aliarcobacter cryaerophilus TaxID=28198 RepID=A0A2S9TIB7_9BACT|nr:hypothetical protein [Aliarcobacter cryaerophilus]PRM90667.1 hypothetical protein CJ671_00975 [Aliarcobacter cryaerophilus]PRM98579.1 hypothetical protein CJ670_03105 [Arcobacter cryaerophilus gv. crypticus]
MALPFIAGLALGALGVVAYKNREIIKKKGEIFFNDAKEKGEILKKDIETKISQTKKKFEKEDTKKVVKKPKTTQTKEAN